MPQIVPLSPAPFDQNMYVNGIMSTSWRTWFSQIWSYAKGPFISMVSGTNNGVMNTTYFADDTVLVSINLPERFNVGDEFRVVGSGSGGWSIILNGKTVRSPSGSATTSVSSTNRYDGVTLVGIVKDLELAELVSIEARIKYHQQYARIK